MKLLILKVFIFQNLVYSLDGQIEQIKVEDIWLIQKPNNELSVKVSHCGMEHSHTKILFM